MLMKPVQTCTCGVERRTDSRTHQMVTDTTNASGQEHLHYTFCT